MIKVTGLKKHFGDLEVLKGIDQHIKQGEKVVVYERETYYFFRSFGFG